MNEEEKKNPKNLVRRTVAQKKHCRIPHKKKQSPAVGEGKNSSFNQEQKKGGAKVLIIRNNGFEIDKNHRSRRYIKKEISMTEAHRKKNENHHFRFL